MNTKQKMASVVAFLWFLACVPDFVKEVFASPLMATGIFVTLGILPPLFVLWISGALSIIIKHCKS